MLTLDIFEFYEGTPIMDEIKELTYVAQLETLVQEQRLIVESQVTVKEMFDQIPTFRLFDKL